MYLAQDIYNINRVNRLESGGSGLRNRSRYRQQKKNKTFKEILYETPESPINTNGKHNFSA